MKLKIISLTLLFSCCYADIPVFNSPEDTRYPIVSPAHDGPDSRAFISLSAGPAWAKPGATQTLYVNPAYVNTYLNQSGSQTLANAELYVGFQFPLMDAFQMQFGPMVGAAGIAKPDGQILKYGLQNNHRYTYNVSQVRGGLRAKIFPENSYEEWIFSPYITGSGGFAYNYSYTYQNTSFSRNILDEPNFGNYGNLAFSYSVGAGLQRDITCNYRVGVGYEYFSWGKSRLAPASGQLTNNVPTINNIYSQSVIISFTYIS
jgi:opacity protein-like surface antigen